MTRDSRLWCVLIVAAVLTSLSTQTALLSGAFPWWGPPHDARLQLASFVVGVVSGLMRMSPLELSAKGRDRLRRESPHIHH